MYSCWATHDYSSLTLFSLAYCWSVLEILTDRDFVNVDIFSLNVFFEIREFINGQIWAWRCRRGNGRPKRNRIVSFLMWFPLTWWQHTEGSEFYWFTNSIAMIQIRPIISWIFFSVINFPCVPYSFPVHLFECTRRQSTLQTWDIEDRVALVLQENTCNFCIIV